MRDILTIVAGVLVVILTVALVAPYFVDWDAQRGFIEAQLSRATGARVVIGGAIDLRLLPTPRLDAEALDAQGVGDGAPRLKVKAARFELAPGALLRGAFVFTEATLDAPRLTVSGRSASPAAAGDAAFERIVVHDGSVAIASGRPDGAAWVVDGLEFAAEAASLQGPFKGAGSFAAHGERRGFRFATARAEGTQLRGKLNIETADGRIELDGLVTTAPVLAFDGRMAAFGRVAETVWSAAGLLKANVETATIDALEVRVGDPDRAMVANGAAAWRAAAHAVDLTLRAKQIDADRLVSALGPSPALPLLPFVVNLDAASPIVAAGGETLTDVSTVLTLDQGVARGLASASGPGGAKAAAQGVLAAGRFDGVVHACARDARLAAASIARITGTTPPLLPIKTLTFDAAIVADAHGVAARAVDATLDGVTVKGRLSLDRQPSPARIEAALATSAVDLDLGGSFAQALSGFDLTLSLEAAGLTTRIGDAPPFDLGALTLALDRKGERTVVSALRVADAAGDVLTAQGSLDPTGGRWTGVLEAKRLDAIAALAQRMPVGAAAGGALVRMSAFAPAHATFSAQTGAAGLRAFTIEGALAGDAFTATLAPLPSGAAGEAQATLRLDTQDAPALLRRAGVAPRAKTPTPGSVAAALGLHPDRPSALTARVALAGLAAAFDGEIGREFASAKGRFTLRAPDGAALEALTGLPAATGAIALAGDMIVDDNGAALPSIAGDIGPTHLAGALDFHGATATGSLRLDRLSATALIALVYGAPRALAAGPIWSDAPFAPPAAAPKAEVDLTIARLGLAPAPDAIEATARLSLAPGLMRFTRLTLPMAGGTIAGEALMRRDGDGGALTATLEAQGLALRSPAFQGVMSGALTLSGAGRSARALVDSLGGGGHLAVRDLQIARTDADALPRVLRQTTAEGLPDASAVGRALARELDHAALALGALTFDANIAAGALRLTPADGSAASVRPSFDLRRLTFDEVVTLDAPAPAEWSGPAPMVSVTWSGPFMGPTRTIDATTLANGLVARAVEIEAARVVVLEAQDRERARRLAEQDRIRQAQETARRAAEAARNAPPQPPVRPNMSSAPRP